MIRKKQPEISVIVALYNVEKYAPYCLESLSKQDFMDYEVICVDDGSTDTTGEIVDEWASRDERFVALHKPNGGLSDARNYGISRCGGNYITLVDGDDIVSPKYLSTLYEAMSGQEDCMVIGGFQSISFSEVVASRVKWESSPKTRAVNREKIIWMLMYDIIKPSACAKLAPKKIYEHINFPVGVHYEEIRTIVDYILEVSRYVVVDAGIYGYVMRDGSITWSSEAKVEQIEEYREAAQLICDKAAAAVPHLATAIDYQLALLYTRIHSQLPRNALRNEDIGIEDRMLIGRLRELLPVVLSDKDAPIKSKIRFALLAYVPYLYDSLYLFYKQKIKGVA